MSYFLNFHWSTIDTKRNWWIKNDKNKKKIGSSQSVFIELSIAENWVTIMFFCPPSVNHFYGTQTHARTNGINLLWAVHLRIYRTVGHQVQILLEILYRLPFFSIGRWSIAVWLDLLQKSKKKIRRFETMIFLCDFFQME